MWTKLVFIIRYAAPLWHRVTDFLAGVWQFLKYPLSLPVLVWVLVIGFGLRSCQNYNQAVRESAMYQDSLIYAQDTELWRLRADTLEAHFQIRELYSKLSYREKQEVMFFSQLRDADDNSLQVALDSLYGKHAQERAGLPAVRQPTSPTSFTSILSGTNLAAPKFNSVSGWSAGNPARQVQSP